MVRYLAILAVLWTGTALAQGVPGQFPPGTIYGNPTGARAPPVAATTDSFGLLSVTSEFHIGEIGQNQTSITSNFATTATAYAPGRAMGALMTLAGMTRLSAAVGAPGTSGQILATVLTFQDGIGVGPVDVYYFDSTPSGGTVCTDNVPFLLAAADRNKVIGVVHVTDFLGSPTTTVGQIGGFPMPYSIGTGTSGFACVVARGTITIVTPGASSLNVRVVRQ